jgi:polyribonucleotide nucleotidyltransferase
MLGAVMFGHREMQKVIDAIIRLAEKAAKEPRDADERILGSWSFWRAMSRAKS